MSATQVDSHLDYQDGTKKVRQKVILKCLLEDYFVVIHHPFHRLVNRSVNRGT